MEEEDRNGRWCSLSKCPDRISIVHPSKSQFFTNLKSQSPILCHIHLYFTKIESKMKIYIYSTYIVYLSKRSKRLYIYSPHEEITVFAINCEITITIHNQDALNLHLRTGQKVSRGRSLPRNQGVHHTSHHYDITICILIGVIATQT